MIYSNTAKYEEDLKKILKGDIRYNLSYLFTYLFYCIKKNDEGDKFKKCKNITEFDKFFHDGYIARYFNEEIENLNVDSIYFLFGLYDTTDIDILREELHDNVQYYFSESSRLITDEGKYGVDDLIIKMLRIKKDQEFLLYYNDSSNIIKRLLDKKIKLSIYFENMNDKRALRNNYYDYFLAKVYIDINDLDVNVLVGNQLSDEKKYDRIYYEYSDLVRSENNALQNDIINKYLNKDGIAVKIISDVILDANSDDMIMMRNKDLDSNMLKSIITFPSTIGARYFRRGTNKAIMLYDNSKKQEKIYMVDAQTLCASDKNSSWFTNENINNIIAYTDKELNGISKSVEYAMIKNTKDVSFAPYEYVDRGILLNNAVELGSVADIRRGNVEYIRTRVRTSNQDDEYMGEYTYKKISPAFLDDENYDNFEEIKTDKDMADNILENGDILMNKNGNPIRIVLFEGDKSLGVVADGNIIIVHPDKNKILPEYLKIYLDSEEGRKSLENIAHSGVTLRSINISRLIKVMVPLVDMEKQTAFVKKYNEILNNIESEKKKLKNECDKCFCK